LQAAFVPQGVQAAGNLEGRTLTDVALEAFAVNADKLDDCNPTAGRFCHGEKSGKGLMKFEDGSVQVPSEPGLGVELDRVALAALHQNYLACGLSKRNDEIEMQKVNPDWTFKAVRW
jgi:hypothetical protein